MKLAYVIKNLREDKELTQEQLAEKSGLTRGYISRLEKGAYPDESPSIGTLRSIAQGLKIDLDYILGEAKITEDDYVNVSPQTFFRSKYKLNENQIQAVEAFIETIKKQFKS